MTGARSGSAVATLPRDLSLTPQLDRWVAVHADGTIDVRVGKVELGQGILTALAQVAADELDVELGTIRMLAAHSGKGPDEGLTSGSMSVFDAAPCVRLACANVRHLFVAEAARRWGVPTADVEVRDGRLSVHGRPETTSYAVLSPSVDLRRDADPAVPVKDSAAARLVGTSTARLDLPDKIAGRPRFIHDLRLPGQLFGRVVRPPSPGASLVAVDESAVVGPGLRVVRDGSFLGVVADDENAAAQGAERLRSACEWAETDLLPDEDDLDGFLRGGPHESISVVDDGLVDGLDDGSDDGSDDVLHDRGRAGLATESSGRVFRATYSRPFIAHASMAPSCAVAEWRDTAADAPAHVQVWSHSQGINNLRDAIQAALELAPGSVEVEHVEGAGCYGHNAADDAAFDAVLLARSVPGHPVHVQWTRRDELTWAPFGPAMTADLEARVNAAGRLVSWSSDVWGQGHTSRPGYAGVPGLLATAHLERPIDLPAAADPPAARGGGNSRNAVPAYDIPRRRVNVHRLLRTPIRSSALRSLGAHLNVFAIESLMDEVALATGQDPLALRLAHLSDPRARRVLEVAAEAGSWGEPTPEGVGRGIGFARYKGRGAYCAVVADVAAEHDVSVRRLAIAVDVGRVVNPDGVRNQLEGGATQATSWTLKERVRFDRRRITSDDWEGYPILRFSEAPEVSVELVAAEDEPSVGAGEAAAGPTSGAIANAVSNALGGVRVRHLPITPDAVVRAIESQDD